MTGNPLLYLAHTRIPAACTLQSMVPGGLLSAAGWLHGFSCAGEGACSNEQDQAYASNQHQLSTSTNTSYAGKGCRGSEALRALFLYMPCLAMMRAADMDKVGMREIALPII